MKVNIDLEMLVGYADDVRNYHRNLMQTRVKHGYRKGRSYWVGTVKEIDDAYKWYERKNDTLSEICYLTGIDYNAVMQMSRIMERYYESKTYQNLGVCLKRKDFERMYEVLTAKTPEEVSGIYGNELFDKAVLAIGW